MSRNNFHTHTVFCDGQDLPEDLVKTAISGGAASLGFSGHIFSDIQGDEPYCMSPENEKKYCAEVLRLREKYKDRIKIYLGVEKDYFSKQPSDQYDYVIGSVHYVLKDGAYVPVDSSEQKQVDGVRKYYGGDYYAFIEDYYATVSDVYRKTRCDIIGHFDLVTKFNEDGHLFDTGHPRYLAAAEKALDKLLKEDVVFEINYGAISRGYRKTPYMDPWMVEKIKAAGRKVIYTSDCHNKDFLFLGIPDDSPEWIR